jgi:hypothetical protein
MATFNFIQRENGPDRLVTEVELNFDADGLTGLKLVGFCIWKSPEGELYVTFPSRAFSAGNERRFFDYVRPVEASNGATKALKEAIIAAYKAHAGDVA